MYPVLFTWVFRLKLSDEVGNVLHKARCCGCGDQQKRFTDYNPDITYAPVATHETLRILLALSDSHNLELEGADISNAYLYGKLDIPVIMEQPRDSSRLQRKPGHVAEVLGSMYGTKQAGKIWGSILRTCLNSWKFSAWRYKARIYFYRKGSEFFIASFVVNDITFASNSTHLRGWLKERLSVQFNVKSFNTLSPFIGWQVSKESDHIKVHQMCYAESLLLTHGIDQTNSVWTPLAFNADLLPAHTDEYLPSQREHSTYRAIIGGLNYLAVCTRPYLAFQIYALPRHLHAPTPRHMSYLKRVLGCVSGTLYYGLNFRHN